MSSLDDCKNWAEIHKKYKLIRLVPETGFALMAKQQRMTAAQKAAFLDSGYVRESYC